MLKKMLAVTFVAVFSAASLGAQARPAQPAPASAAEKPQPPAAKAPPEPLPTVNVKIEVSITDQTGNNAPARKVVTMVAGDRQNTNIRSSASVPVRSSVSNSVNYRNVTINVDARPTVLKEANKVLVTFGLEYLPRTAGGSEEIEAGMAQLSERLGIILESGKSMVVSQAADPGSDRKITVEVTATILK